MSILLVAYLGNDASLQTAFAGGDSRLVSQCLSKELGFELEVEAAEQGMRASLPLASEEQQRVRLFLAERFSVAEQRTQSASGEDSSGIGKYAFIIDFFRAGEFRNRHAAMEYLEDLLKRSNIGEVVIDFAVPLKRGHALRATIRCTVATWVKVQQMVAGVGRVREVSEAEDLQARKRTRASAEQCVDFGKAAHLLAALRPAGGRKSKARRTVDRLSVALEFGARAAAATCAAARGEQEIAEDEEEEANDGEF